EQVSWEEVQRFFDELTRRVAGPTFGLPSEAQWEYACRAGTSTARYAEVDAIAWCWHNSGGTTHPVAQKQPNAWGFYDMLGNVWEWCADGPRAFASTAVTDPVGPSRERRSCRGGSWGDDARFARSACRISYEPDYRYGSVGFRLALSR
ncbi:MAG TPA: formylglycine-generating enzyme family protein, partial [Enhygromyxa sp.]|nr:formylglycine-generating enzyme family protein [Enhygromyxa sp.]